MHVDLGEFIVACGGNPDNQDDVDKALEVIQRVTAEHTIPTEVRE